jgi:serine/threonine protein kinase
VKVINITNKKDELKAIEEIKRMIKLRHPRVIELYKYSVDETNSGTHIYMVMQRMQSDLSSYRFTSFADKLRIIKQIVEGLRMLHE